MTKIKALDRELRKANNRKFKTIIKEVIYNLVNPYNFKNYFQIITKFRNLYLQLKMKISKIYFRAIL